VRALAQPDREHAEAEQRDDREQSERDPCERVAVGGDVDDPHHQPSGGEGEVAEDARGADAVARMV
jgi:hypothetical protein